MGFCSPKSSRRSLVIVNIGMALTGFIFLIIGGISLHSGTAFEKGVWEYCRVECVQIGCTDETCLLDDGTESLPSCNCKTGSSDIPTYFTAPASGLIAVGVFSMLVSIVGCIAAIRIKSSWLCGYIIMVAFVMLLQFSFGVAGATAASLSHVPDAMKDIFDTHYRVFDWSYLSDLMPKACYVDHSEYTDRNGETISVQHPACGWDGACNVTTDDLGCCTLGHLCTEDEDKRDTCMSASQCVGGFLHNVGTPVAVSALLTLLLQVLAISWACVIRRETRPGGTFDPARDHL